METPPEIEFVGMTADDQIQAEVGRHVAQLEQRFGRITSCRLSVRAPGPHHQNGNVYDVTVHLVLPGHRDIVVTPALGHGQSFTDVRSALGDAFRRARRQLNDRVRRMEGQTKTHESPSGDQ